MLYILLIFVCFLSFILWCILPAKPEEIKQNLLGRAYAHRGLHAQNEQIPENSIPAFARAVKEGYGIELDVRLTKDQKVIVFHDDTLTRMCGINSRVIDYTYDELLTYRLADSPEQIPLFSEVLACINGCVPLIVELKQVKEYKTLCAYTCELLEQYDGEYCIESFDPRIVGWFKKNAPEITRGQLSCKLTKKDVASGALRIALTNLFLNFMTRPHFIAYNQDHMNNPFFCFTTKILAAVPAGWTIRSQKEFDQQRDLGTQMIIFENFRPEPRF